MRKLYVLFISLIIVAAISGCKETETLLEETDPVVLKFYMRGISKDSVTGSLVNEYNRIQDNVKVEFEVFGENYKNVVSIALLSDSPPDIFEINGGLSIYDLAKGNYILPLDAYLDEEHREAYYPEVFEQEHLYYRNRLYTIPERLAYFKLFYNKDLFRQAGLNPEEPPKTVRDMLTYAELISEAGNGDFYGFGLPLKTGTTFERYIDNISSVSMNMNPRAYNAENKSFDFAAQNKVFNSILELKRSNGLYPNPTVLDVEVSRALFGEGKFAMMIDGSWMPAIYNNGEVPNSQDWAVADIPVVDDYDRAFGYINYDMGKVISSESEHPDEAWAFIEFLLDHQESYVKKGEPLRTKILANQEAYYPKGHIGYESFADISNYKAYPIEINQVIDIDRSEVNTVYMSMFMEEITLEEGSERLNQLYSDALDDAYANNRMEQ